ncbi:MAG TPA: helicase associated domain-containing protein [Actinocatenispora sp.]
MAEPAQTGSMPPEPGHRTDPAWDVALTALTAYAVRHGHTYPPRDARTPDGRSLATWVSNARYAYHRGVLRPDRAAALAAVPHWVWRTKSPRRRLDTGLARWNLGYPRLVDWVATHGRIPPVGAIDDDGYRVGRFARNCRQHRARLTTEQRAALLRLPAWTWDVAADRRRTATERLAQARTFVARHHHLPQRDADDADERNLAAWLRRSHPTLTDDLTEVRRAAVPDTWLRRYRLAAAGDTSKSTVEWMSRQRAAARRGTLPDPHSALFAGLRGSQERRWQQRAAELRQAVRRGRRPTESALGWLARQRRRADAGTLGAPQRAELAELTELVRRFRAENPPRRPPVTCQRPGCTTRIQPPARGRAPRYCGRSCATAARRRSSAASPTARSAAALIRLVPALERVAAGRLTGLPALTRRVQRAADALATGTSRVRPAASRRHRRHWHAGVRQDAC